jgi:hypothetical protein
MVHIASTALEHGNDGTKRYKRGAAKTWYQTEALCNAVLPTEWSPCTKGNTYQFGTSGTTRLLSPRSVVLRFRETRNNSLCWRADFGDRLKLTVQNGLATLK